MTDKHNKTNEPASNVLHNDIEKNEYTIIDNTGIRKDIIIQIVQPNYMKDLGSLYTWRNISGKFASIFFTVSVIVMSTSTFLSFISSYYNDSRYSLVAGCIGVAAIVSDRFAHYCSGWNSNCTKKINMLLKSVGINDSIPDISDVAIDKDTTKQKTDTSANQ